MFFKLVDMGVDPCTRLPRSEYTLLHMAARHNRAWCLPFLIVERGLDVNAQEKTEALTPLMVAVFFRSYDVIRELIATYKADVTHSASGETAVHIAAGRDYGCLRLMHSLGCDLRVGTNSNPKYTILHAAASSGNLLCMQWLLHMRYFDVNVRDISGRTPLHFALTRLRHSASVNLILWLVQEADADVDAQDYHQTRPLNAAVSYPLVVDWLLENGATDGRSSDGLTALEVAMDYDGQVETLLLRSVRLSRLP
jgi:ankyrin repeat protein